MNPQDISDLWNSSHFGLETNVSTTDTGETSGASSLVTENQRAMAEVISVALCSLTGYLGIVANIITIMVFVKLGFQDTMNINMTYLAFWDFLRCFSMSVFQLYEPIGRLTTPSVGLTYHQMTGTTFLYLFFFSSLTSTALAGYVAIERCLCVSKPFLVKQILTPRVTTVANSVISIIVFGSLAVNYSQYMIVWDYYAPVNATIALRAQSSLFLPSLVTYYNVLSIAWPMISFVICVCTVIIFHYLKKSSKFRSKMSAVELRMTSSPNHLTPRDRRVIKILLVILTVYIVTLLPRLSRYLVKLAVPEFKFMGVYNNMFFIFTYFMYFFDVINAAVNPFIFYFMSSQFKVTLHSIVRAPCRKHTT